MKETRKWILHRISALILAPLYVWFYFSCLEMIYTLVILELPFLPKRRNETPNSPINRIVSG